MTQLPYLDAAAVRHALPFDRALQAITAGLRDGVDPEVDSPRLFSPAPNGEFLLMPAQGTEFSGLKALTVAPNNPARGLEKIQGLYVLIDSDSLAPVAILDGASLTAIRTAAVTITAVGFLADAAPLEDRLPEAPRVLIFGAGVQAQSHVEACRIAFPGSRFTIVGRNPHRVEALLDRLGDVDAAPVPAPTDDGRPDRIRQEIESADIILCTTSSDTPVFDGSLVVGGTIVTAVGTHGTQRREVDDDLVTRADLLVEGRRSAERENGNLATAVSSEDWAGPNAPWNLRDAALGRMTRRVGHPALYTGVGMSWEDLLCASSAFSTFQGEQPN